MRILVCGWVGSTNLGDELVLAGVRALVGTDATITAVSIAPAATRRDHGIVAIDHRRADLLLRAARSADLVVLGGGGLIQDETSPLNLPYHLSRTLAARLGRTPYVGLALGVGRLTTPLGRHLAATLRHAAGITVRDEPSQALLAELGVDARLAADAAFHLAGPAPIANPGATLEGRAGGPVARSPVAPDRLVVSLRPWNGGGGLLPVGWRARTPATPDWLVPTLAGTLDRASKVTGLAVRFVAMQTDRDVALHDQLARVMTVPTERVTPDRHTVLAELARGRVVVAMRYHAGVGATLAGRPSVLVGYSPKVDALAATLGDGARLLGFDRAAMEGLGQAIIDQAASTSAPAAVRGGLETLLARAEGNRDLLREVTSG